MGKSILLFLTFVIYVVATSCSHDEVTMSTHNIISQNTNQQTSIYRSTTEAIQQAVSDRNNMLGISTHVSRSELDIRCIKHSNASRSDDSDTLLYIINFPNDEGYAIIPSNRYMPTLALTESGYFSSIDEMENPAAKIILQTAVMQTLINNDSVAIGHYEPFVPEQPDFEILITDTIEEIHAPAKATVKWGEHGSSARYCTNNADNPPTNAVGSVPLALCMALSVIEYPKNLNLTFPGHTFNSILLDWKQIKEHTKEQPYFNYCTCDASYEAHDQFAYLCRQVGHLCNADYQIARNLSAKTFANLYGVQNALQILHISHSDIMRTESNSVFSKISSGKGIAIMYGISNHGPHGWLCDGYYYLKCEDNVYKKSQLSTTVGGTDLIFLRNLNSYEYKYLHINWGYDGKDNGYYQNGIFDTSTIHRYLDDENDGHWTSGTFTNISFIAI